MGPDALDSLRSPASVVTVGTYDGVHLGHRQLIAEARRQALELGINAVVVTFDRHPLSVLRPEKAPRLLTGLEHRVELLRSTGVDDVVVLRFDRARASEVAEDFVERVLVGELGARAVVVGASFRFGHDHLGDVEMLARLGDSFGFRAMGVELTTDQESGAVVSSLRIRELVAGGDLELAGRLLGRDHELRGVAVMRAGAFEGALGVVIPGELCVPPPGAYWAQVGPIGSAELPAIVELDEVESSPTGEIVLGVRPRPEDIDRRIGPWPATGTRCAVRLLAAVTQREQDVDSLDDL